MDAIPIGMLMRLLGKLPAVFIRRYYSQVRVAQLVSIDVRARGDQIRLDCGRTPMVEVWLSVRNQNPFPVELDRICVSLWRNGYGSLGELWGLERTEIAPGAALDCLVKGLHGVRYEVTEILRDPNCIVEVRAFFNSKVRAFRVNTGQMHGAKISVVNYRTDA